MRRRFLPERRPFLARSGFHGASFLGVAADEARGASAERQHCPTTSRAVKQERQTPNPIRTVPHRVAKEFKPCPLAPIRHQSRKSPDLRLSLYLHHVVQVRYPLIFSPSSSITFWRSSQTALRFSARVGPQEVGRVEGRHDGDAAQPSASVGSFCHWPRMRVMPTCGPQQVSAWRGCPA